MEMRLSQSKDNLKAKIPDIQKTLQMVNYLQEKKVFSLQLFHRVCTFIFPSLNSH